VTLRIVHCLAPAPVGGLETVVRLLANGQHARGHQVLVVCVVEEKPHPFSDVLTNDGIGVEVIQLPGRAYLQERTRVADVLRRMRPDVVHAHGFRPDLIDLPAARAQGIPTVSTLHGFLHGDWKVSLYEWLQLRRLRQNSAVIAVSSGIVDKTRAHRVPQRLVHLIPNAYTPAAAPLRRAEARDALGLENDAIHVAWVGRLSSEKGPDIALDAMTRVADLPISLSILGDGPMRATLESEAKARGLRVKFHGRVENAARLLPAFDGYLLSSRLEGTPMVILEAMAARVPIITAAVGGVPDMLASNEAYLVTPESSDAFADALRTLAQLPQESSERSRRAYARWERDFTITPWLDRHDALYSAIQRTNRR
jgi:glycosyltransferase involved in cell wall biosynthesis